MPTRSPMRPLLLVLALAISPTLPAAGVFSAYTLEGESVQLSEFFEPHKWTLVMIWTTYCKVCAEQFPLIEALHVKHHDRLLKVVGVAADGLAARDAVAAELVRRKVSFGSLIGESTDIAASVLRSSGEPFSGTPTYLLFDQQGELAARISGPISGDAIEHYIDGERS